MAVVAGKIIVAFIRSLFHSTARTNVSQFSRNFEK